MIAIIPERYRGTSKTMSFEPETGVETENEYEGVPEVAVIGMAARLPGADDLDAFWRSLRDGVECIRTFTPDELRAAGQPEPLIADPAFVPRFGPLDHRCHPLW
jgi:hypothetical protein